MTTPLDELVSSTAKVVAQHILEIAKEEREKDHSKFTVEQIINRVKEEYGIE